MENTTSFFEEKINALDAALIELRVGSWGRNLPEYKRIEQYYNQFKKIMFEYENMLKPKMIGDEKERLGWMKEYLSKITTINEDDVVDDEEGNIVDNIHVVKTDFRMGIAVLTKMEELFRDVIERLTTKARTH